MCGSVLCWRFLQEFEQFVGTLRIHLLRQPDKHHLIPSLAGFQAEFPHNRLTLVGIDDQLLILCPRHLHPFRHPEIGTSEQLFTPFLQELITIGVLATSSLVDGESEVQVRVLQLLRHRIVTQQPLCVCHCNGQSPTTFRTIQHQGMWHPPLLKFIKQALLHSVLCDDLVEHEVVVYGLQFTVYGLQFRGS